MNISYGWWKKSCTSWYGKIPIIYKFLYILGGCLGFLNHQQYFQWFLGDQWFLAMRVRHILRLRFFEGLGFCWETWHPGSSWNKVLGTLLPGDTTGKNLTMKRGVVAMMGLNLHPPPVWRRDVYSLLWEDMSNRAIFWCQLADEFTSIRLNYFIWQLCFLIHIKCGWYEFGTL